MPASSPENYLATEVKTASPQKLHLLLVEAALHSAQRAGQQWHACQDEQALQSLVHAQAVVSELMCGLDKKSKSDFTERVMALYAYIFRCLAEAGLRHDRQKLADAIRLLEFERETWRQLCQQLAVQHRVDQADAVPPPAGQRAVLSTFDPENLLRRQLLAGSMMASRRRQPPGCIAHTLAFSPFILYPSSFILHPLSFRCPPAHEPPADPRRP